jgi:hypothetical protein
MNTTDLAPVKGCGSGLIEVSMRMRYKAIKSGPYDDYYYVAGGTPHNEVGPQEIFKGDTRVDWFLGSEPIWRDGYED